jgi:WD40 repeat protein
MEIVEDTLYIADQNKIHIWDGTTATQDAMQLPTYVNITSLRKHPDGRHLIAFCGTGANYSHTRGTQGRVYIIDTVTLEWIREINVETQVEGSRLKGGVVYVTYGAKVGYFNGEGITYLKTLSVSTLTYSHNIAVAEDILLVRDGRGIRAYGDLGSGGNVWWQLSYNIENTNEVTNVSYLGNGKIAFAYTGTAGTYRLYEIDTNETGQTGRLWSNQLQFPNKAWIRRIEIEHTPTAASGTNTFIINYRNADGTITALHTASTTDLSVTRTRVDVNIPTSIGQIGVQGSVGAIGYRQVRLYVDNGE